MSSALIPAVGSDRGRERGNVVGVFLPELSQLGERERGHGVDRLSGRKHTLLAPKANFRHFQHYFATLKLL